MSSQVDMNLYKGLQNEFKKMDSQFKELQEILNNKHIENLEIRKEQSREKERIKILEEKQRERARDVTNVKRELQATQAQLSDTDREQKKLKDLGIESMNKYESLAKEQRLLEQKGVKDISSYKDRVEELTHALGDKQFEIEQLQNDINSKNTQLDKQETRINYFMQEVERQKEAREADKRMFERDIINTNMENDEFRKTIYSLKMREMNTARIVSNAEHKIREQHELRETLIKKLRKQESDFAEVSTKLKNKSERLYNLKGKYQNETKKITSNLLNRSMQMDGKKRKVSINADLNRSFTELPKVDAKKSCRRGMDAFTYVNNQRKEISEDSQRDSLDSVSIKLKEADVGKMNVNEVQAISLMNTREVRTDKFMLTSSTQGSFQDKYLSMKESNLRLKQRHEDESEIDLLNIGMNKTV